LADPAVIASSVDVPEVNAIRWVLLGGVASTAALIAVELTAKGSRHVELAIHEMTKGAYGRQFWIGGVIVGLIVPAAAIIVSFAADIDNPVLAAIAGIAALIGLFAYEDSFVRAGQSVPLS